MWNNLTGAFDKRCISVRVGDLVEFVTLGQPFCSTFLLRGAGGGPLGAKGREGLPSLPPSLTLLEKEGGKEEDQTALRESKEGRDGERGGACLLA